MYSESNSKINTMIKPIEWSSKALCKSLPQEGSCNRVWLCTPSWLTNRKSKLSSTTRKTSRLSQCRHLQWETQIMGLTLVRTQLCWCSRSHSKCLKSCSRLTWYPKSLRLELLRIWSKEKRVILADSWESTMSCKWLPVVRRPVCWTNSTTCL